VMGHYSDGKDRELSSGLTWTSSDAATVAVTATGLLTPWAKGEVQITALDAQSGLSAVVTVTARAVVAVRTPLEAPVPGQVDTGDAFFHVSGLTPGTMYTPSALDLSDDVDLYVYSDMSMSPETLLCGSLTVGDYPEQCVAPAGPSGELWIRIDGQYTRSGASFRLDLPPTAPVTTVATLAFPDGVPYVSAVGATNEFLSVTGLTPGATYQVKLSGLAADLDVAVYADPYEYASLCESYLDGTVDDACDATAGAGGEFVIEIDGRTSPAGSGYTLSVTPR
jgi:Bacterial Ig-like domain (group 2)